MPEKQGIIKALFMKYYQPKEKKTIEVERK